MKKIVYIDLDGVVADFDRNVHLLGERDPAKNECNCPPNYFIDLPLIEGAKEAIEILGKEFELFFLSTPQWSNPLSYMEKRLWVGEHFGESMFKKLILSHDKTLLRGDFLIDDRVQQGYSLPEYEHIHFGSEKFPHWTSVTNYLIHWKMREEIKKGV